MVSSDRTLQSPQRLPIEETHVPLVYVVDDEPLVLGAVERLLGTVGLSCRTYSDGADFLVDVDLERGGCVVLDIRLPGLGGTEIHRMLGERGSILPVIFVTGYGDVPLAVRAMKAGAIEVLTKPIDSHALLGAVQYAIEHDRQRRTDRDAIRRLRQRADRLTAREREVMTLVVSGWTNRRIADYLGTTEKTIKVHRGNVMTKMEASSIVELVRMADRLSASSAEAGRPKGTGA